MCSEANASHIGSCLSIADILAVLYNEVLSHDPKRPDWPDRDRFLLSKGHAAAVLYAVLAECGYFPRDWLSSYGRDDSLLLGHASHYVPGVEFSTGSLGHGLPVACGLALAAKWRGSRRRVVVLMSDGELDEGSNWEALLFAGHQKLDRLCAIIDYNRIQSFGRTNEVLDLEPLVDKLTAFRWHVREVNGHDIPSLRAALRWTEVDDGFPQIVVAHTVKGKGVSFMEDRLEWHYKAPNPSQLAAAVRELAAF